MDGARAKGASSQNQNIKLISHKRRQKKKLRGYVTKGALRRLARRGGVKRLSALIYDEMRDVLNIFLTSLVRDALIYCEYSARTTVLAEDVIRAMRNRGQRLYGFDEIPNCDSVRTSIRMADTPEGSIVTTVEVPDSETNLEDSDATVDNIGATKTASTSSAAEVNNILPKRKSTLRNSKVATENVQQVAAGSSNSNVTKDSALPTRPSRSSLRNPVVSLGKNAGENLGDSSKSSAAVRQAALSGTKNKKGSTTPKNNTERTEVHLRPGNLSDSEEDFTTSVRKRSKTKAGAKAVESPAKNVAESSLSASLPEKKDKRHVRGSKSTAKSDEVPEDSLYNSESTVENTILSFRSPYRNVSSENNFSPVVQLENIEQVASPGRDLRSQEEIDFSPSIFDYDAGLSPRNPFDDD